MAETCPKTIIRLHPHFYLMHALLLISRDLEVATATAIFFLLLFFLFLSKAVHVRRNKRGSRTEREREIVRDPALVFVCLCVCAFIPFIQIVVPYCLTLSRGAIP